MSSLFLFFVFFFPRLTLLLVWLFGTMPANGTPFLADLLGAIFAPRLLIAWWLYEAQARPFLIGLFVVFGILEFVGGGSLADGVSYWSSIEGRVVRPGRDPPLDQR